MSIAHLDYETTSESDIMSVGGYRYSVDPSTRILMFAIAEDDGDPVLWTFDDPYSEESMLAETMLERVISEGHLLYCHNYAFELAISHHRLRTDVGTSATPRHENYRCIPQCKGR